MSVKRWQQSRPSQASKSLRGTPWLHWPHVSNGIWDSWLHLAQGSTLFDREFITSFMSKEAFINLRLTCGLILIWKLLMSLKALREHFAIIKFLYFMRRSWGCLILLKKCVIEMRFYILWKYISETMCLIGRFNIVIRNIF